MHMYEEPTSLSTLRLLYVRCRIVGIRPFLCGLRWRADRVCVLMVITVRYLQRRVHDVKEHGAGSTGTYPCQRRRDGSQARPTASIILPRMWRLASDLVLNNAAFLSLDFISPAIAVRATGDACTLQALLVTEKATSNRRWRRRVRRSQSPELVLVLVWVQRFQSTRTTEMKGDLTRKASVYLVVARCTLSFGTPTLHGMPRMLFALNNPPFASAKRAADLSYTARTIRWYSVETCWKGALENGTGKRPRTTRPARLGC